MVKVPPGQGLFWMPEWEKVLDVYSVEDARTIIAAAHRTPVEGDAASKLADFLKSKGALQVVEHSSAALPMLNFSAVASEGTRSFVNRKEVNWDEIKTLLEGKGFTLHKREFLDGKFDTLCPVYLLSSEEYGVIAEGKGLTDEQAQRSAMAEGVERIFGSVPPSKDAIIFDTYRNLYAGKSWDLSAIAGTRDPFAKDIPTEWLPAINVQRKEAAYLPAEMSFFDYSPQFTKTRLFSLHHTTGLAAGSSVEEAAISGLFEVIKRDAYWITMRCKVETPDIPLDKVVGLDPKILAVVEMLEQQGFSLFIKDMSLDWGTPVAHAILQDRSGRIPAFTHGTGASFTWSVAVSRAVCEVLQMYSGQLALTKEDGHWQEIAAAANAPARPEWMWSDPLFAANIQHLITRSSLEWNSTEGAKSVDDYLAVLAEKGYEVVVAPLAEVGDLKVVRTFITNATQPDPRLERISPRLESWRKKLGLNGYFTDPILT